MLTRRMFLPLCTAGFVSVSSLPGLAASEEIVSGDLTIMHAEARPNLPNRPTAAYLTIANAGVEPDRLTGVAAADFEAAEMHLSAQEDGVMKMRPVDEIAIPAGASVALAPGGYHLMLFGGRTLFKPGDTFEVVLEFARGGRVAVPVAVVKMAGHSH